jgi:tight adherence protein B
LTTTALAVAATVTLGIGSMRRAAAASTGRLGRVLPRAEVTTTKPALIGAAGAASVAGLVLALGAATSVALVCVALAAALFVACSRKRSLDRETRSGAVDLCRATAAELRAGRPSSEAFAAAAAGCPEPLALVLRSAVAVGRRGDHADLADAIDAVASTRGRPELDGLRRISACWRVAAVSGAALAPAIDRVADALQDEIDLSRDVATILAGPRATVQLLAALPVVGLLLGTAIGARPLGFLLQSEPGLMCLCAAIALDIVGVAWARRIAVRAARLG